MVKPLSNEQIRSFIAIELPEEVKAGLRRIQTELKLPGHTFVKWVATESVHLTLKFLGNIPPQKVAEITGVMEQASQGIGPFQLEVTEVGAFPNLRQPRVLWVGIKGDIDKLIAWQQHLDNGLVPLGFAKEARAFTPHLTLARLREGCSPEDRRNFGEMVAKTPIDVSYKFNVNSLNLMKSQLLPGGAVYNRLAEVKLKG